MFGATVNYKIVANKLTELLQ